MRWKLGMAAAALGLAAWPAAVEASGDYSCFAEWSLVARDLNCANRIVIGPGNDTRVNLMLLLRDNAGLEGGGAYPEFDAFAGYGHTFFEWGQLVGSLYPRDPAAPEREYDVLGGTRCQSVRRGGEEFLAAAARNRQVGAGDRAKLAQGRAAVLALCEEHQGNDVESTPAALADLALPRSFASLEAREFGTYLAGAGAFYAGDWSRARLHFTSLRTARDPWVREAGLYMAARSELGAASATALDEWGYFDAAAADQALAQRADRSFEAYLEAYPAGRYAASAAGLVRRARWLGGALDKQGEAYARLLAEVDPATEAAADLLEEIDNKFLFEDGAGEALEGPWLLAMHDLLRMRTCEPVDEYSCPEDAPAPLTAAELAGQEAAFAGHADLYAFLQANHAFYVEKDYRAVLRLLPDDARQPSYTPLQFSRQVLRGMALGELEDRNEAGFWQELIGGAKGLYQRPTVELGLALSWERAGQAGKVFAAGSPIEDPTIRSILLEKSAGPEVLRAVAGGAGRDQAERDLAAYVLLYKELSRGSYAEAARDFALARADGPTSNWTEAQDALQTPVGLFARGEFSDGYACPALRETVAQLARNRRHAKARLCLGDFYRLNGFDQLEFDLPRGDGEPTGELGTFAAYPGARIPRSQLYAEIIAEPGVAREERAYALYRAVYCYAPAGYSSCGGEDVAESQRAAWFNRLKREFGDTRWGREIEYYW